ncbi:MAG: metallophosphoesterase, partial [Candidatus Hydrogenedentes bacterium]|nr:metallophosphoesterase [Candidatus Hydrogenedentota bacterium]
MHIKQPVGKADARVNGSRRRGEERRHREQQHRQTWWGAMGHRLKPTVLFGVLLRAARLYKRGYANYLRPGLNELTFSFANLPPAFDGFRILYVADLHFDPRYEAFIEPVQRLIDSVETDLCCFGGDYFFEHFGEIGFVRDSMARLVEAVHAPQGMLGVLGNHDMSPVIAPFEALGIRMLMNEHMAIEKDGDTIWVIGVDDTS